MKTMTAKEAKTHFGEFLDAMQREPVIVTKNNRPVGVMLSIQDAADTLVPEMFMEKEAGYEEWFVAKVGTTLDKLNNGRTTSADHETVMARVRAKLDAKKTMLTA